MNFCRKTYWKGTALENKPWIITSKWGPKYVNWPKTESSSRFLWRWQWTSSSKNTNILVFTGQLNDFTAFEKLSSMTLAGEKLCSLAILKHRTKNMSKIYRNIILTFTKNNRRICDFQSPTTSHKKTHQYYKRLLPYNSKTVVHMKPADVSIRKYTHSLVIMWLCAINTSKIHDVYQRWHIRAHGNWVTQFMPPLQVQNSSKQDIKPA